MLNLCITVVQVQGKTNSEENDHTFLFSSS